jgi:hypothetical protein
MREPVHQVLFPVVHSYDAINDATFFGLPSAVAKVGSASLGSDGGGGGGWRDRDRRSRHGTQSAQVIFPSMKGGEA